MKLNNENYFSPEAMTAYFSVSQYKDFCGTLGMRGCEAMALAKMRGEWKMEMTLPLLIGSYVDAHFEGTLDVFKAQHPKILTKKGELLAPFQHANTVIARIERDPYFMLAMSGQKQVILTGEIFGVKWKCKIDSLIKGICMTDLKVMAALRDSFWVKDVGYMSFVEYWGYDIQAAVYQELGRVNGHVNGEGNKLDFLIAAASKEKYPDIEVIGFTPQDLDNALSTISPDVERIKQLKAGLVEPDRCESCDFCRSTKVLKAPMHFSKLILRV